MDDEQRQLLRLLLDPRISEFVDWRKFLASPTFAEIGQSLIDHYIRHGDHSRIKLMLEQFTAYKAYKPMLLWFCDTAGLDFAFVGAELVLKRSSSPRTVEGRLENYIAAHSGTAKDVGGMVVAAPKRQQILARLFNPEGRRGGSPHLQGGAPGLGKRS